MQLGELQNQIDRFNRRNATIIAISVDAPTDSLAMLKRLGLSYPLGSDPQQKIVKAFRVQNPDTQELALHAVYIIDEQAKVFYRKVALRRPVSAELIDAIDAHLGTYPQNDKAQPRKRVAVAYPQNNFQALIEVSKVEQLPESIDAKQLDEVLKTLTTKSSDDALFAFKRLIQGSTKASDEELFATSAWLIRSRFFSEGNANSVAAMKAGKDLSRRIARVKELEGLELAARNSDEHDGLLHQLAAARAGLTRVRSEIDGQAQVWNLRYAKASLRGYREVVGAVLRGRER